MPSSERLQGFAVTDTTALTLERTAPLSEMYTLSPFVWTENEAYHMLVRAVPHSEVAAEKIARVYYGVSHDGLQFTMDAEPTIPPGPGDLDCDGCEDPTLAIVDRTYYVYYTGWNQNVKRGELLLASGSNVRHLEKRGIALPWTKEPENPKEATIVQTEGGSWRLFFEYAADGASKIGIATAPHVSGPWKVLDLPFPSRPNSWDSWHLSTGPMLTTDPQRPVMFYNGASESAEWRIGWVEFDAEYTHITQRCEAPVITPPQDRAQGDTDIAFAASATEKGGVIHLYYSIADKDMFRATIRSQTA